MHAIFNVVLALSTAEQQATLVQCEVAPPDRHGHSALTSILISLLCSSKLMSLLGHCRCNARFLQQMCSSCR